MAVVNSPWVGNARGKLGEGVYYRSKGNTVARAYNPSPENRRTVSQQQQRSLFSSAVKFFARGVQNLFVFAFENKKPQESDYNAFMRFNAKRGMYFGPAQNDDDTYPALGDFVMTRGSLGTFSTRLPESGPVLDIPVSGLATTPTTLGELSAALVAGGLADGDILTFLGITTDSGLGTAAAPVELGAEVPNWQLKQVTLDIASGDLLSNLGFTANYSNPPGVLSVGVDNFGSYDEGIACGCVVVSRIDGGQLRVSNSDLMLNEAAATALDLGRSITWRNTVMAEWNAEQLSVLQGGISVNSVEPNSSLRVAYTFQTPISNTNLDGQGFLLSQVLAASDLARLLVMQSASVDATFEVVSASEVSVMGNTSQLGSWILDPSQPRRWTYQRNESASNASWQVINLSEF